jgi:hypothetical protein
MSGALPRMTRLFQQLGLDFSEHAIADFIHTHQLATDVGIADAPYWSAAQRQFLREALAADALWTTTVDQLNESLHEDAVKASMASKQARRPLG